MKESAILYFISIPTLVVFFYALIIYRTLPREIKIFSWFLFLSGVVELVSKILWFKSINNLPLLHIYVAGGFFFLVLFYESIVEGFIDKKITRGILIVFLLFTSVNSLFIQPVFTFNSYALTAKSVLIVILSLSTYMVMLNDISMRTRGHITKSLNWINAGLFAYYTSNLLIFYFGNVIVHFLPKEFSLQTWTLHAFFLFVMNFCFFMGLWYSPKLLSGK